MGMIRDMDRSHGVNGKPKYHIKLDTANLLQGNLESFPHMIPLETPMPDPCG